MLRRIGLVLRRIGWDVSRRGRRRCRFSLHRPMWSAWNEYAVLLRESLQVVRLQHGTERLRRSGWDRPWRNCGSVRRRMPSVLGRWARRCVDLQGLHCVM